MPMHDGCVGKTNGVGDGIEGIPGEFTIGSELHSLLIIRIVQFTVKGICPIRKRRYGAVRVLRTNEQEARATIC